MEYAVGGFGVLFILAGFYLLVKAGKGMNYAKAAQTWPQTQCNITKCKIHKEYSSQTDGSGQTRFFANIKYSYRVENSNYSNDEISIGGDVGTSNRDTIEGICNKYSTGSTHEIFYNPDDPEEAYLELSTRSHKISIIGGLVFILAGIVILWIYDSMRSGLIVPVT